MNPAHAGRTNITDYNWEETEAGGPRVEMTEGSIAAGITICGAGSVQATDSNAKTSDTVTNGALSWPSTRIQTAHGLCV